MRPLVHPSPSGVVICGECRETMHPVEYREVGGVGYLPWLGRPWLFWRCANGHVSEMIPLPR